MKKKCKLESNLGGDATDIEASATEGTTLLNTSVLETQLSDFDGSHIATEATADDNDVIFLNSEANPLEKEVTVAISPSSFLVLSF